MVFGKKKLEKQLAELALQKEQQQQAQRWKEIQMQEQLAALALQKEQQEQAQRWKELQMQEQIRIQEDEHRRKEQQWENERRERQRKQHERREKERQEQELREREELRRKEREQQRLKRLKSTSPEALRGLRDLIRTRYQLDMHIWSLKGARGPDRPLVVEKMRKADAVLMDIYTMIETWEENDKIWTAEEWKLAQKIKERILAEGKIWWENNPPWNNGG
jgi:hypothetical protein